MWNWCRERTFFRNTFFPWNRSLLFSTYGIIQFACFIGQNYLPAFLYCFSQLKEGMELFEASWTGKVGHLKSLPGPDGTGGVSDLIFHRKNISEENLNTLFLSSIPSKDSMGKKLQGKWRRLLCQPSRKGNLWGCPGRILSTSAATVHERCCPKIGLKSRLSQCWADTHTNTKKNCSEESDIHLASACFDHSKMPPEVKYPVLKWSRGNCKGSARWLLRFRLLVEDLPQVQHWYFLTFPIYQFIHFIHIIQFSKWGRASFATSCWAPQSQARFGTRCSSGQLERERCTRYLHGTDGMSSIHTAFALGNGGMLINSSRQKWNKVKCQRLSCRLLVTFPKTLQVCWLLVSTTTERASLSYKIYVEWASWIFILWIETV